MSSSAETIVMMGAAKSGRSIRHLIDASVKASEEYVNQKVFSWNGSFYEIIDSKRPRNMESIFISNNKKKFLLDDLNNFFISKDRYFLRGDPYRRTYVLYGPPGSGKTSLAQAIAGHIKKDVYLINLSSVADDRNIQLALNSIEKKGIGLIEDIDAFDVSTSRSSLERKSSNNTGLTLSGLLNALDGIAAREGRLLFITSNHIDHLDPALLRNGRIDVRLEIGFFEKEQAIEMTYHYIGNNDISNMWFEENVEAKLPIQPSKLREMLLRVVN